MAQSYTTTDGVTLIDPGTVVSLTVQAGNSSTAASGVVTIIGEADQGPGFLDEADLSLNQFTPTQLGQVVAKYGTGRIVDAFNELVKASNDPNIIGAVTAVNIVKTNMSAPATGSLAMRYQNAPTYASAIADQPGANGNLIQYQSTVAVAEQAPSTGLINYAPAITGTVLFGIRVNGGPLSNVTVTAKEAPSAVVSSIQNIPNGILATGGLELFPIPASGLTLSAAPVSASVLLVTLQVGSTWADQPQAGDVAVIPLSGDYGAGQLSAIAGAGNANAGTYIVQAVTNTVSTATITLLRVSTTGALVSASGTTHSDMTDLILFTQIEVQNISGDDRNVATGVYGTYNVSLNNSTQIQITAPAPWNCVPQAGDILKVPNMLGTINPGFYQVTAGTATTLTATILSNGSSGSGTGTFIYSSGAEPFQLLAAVLSGTGKTLSFEGDVSAIFLNAQGTDAGLSNSRLVSASEEEMQLTILQGTKSTSYTAGGDIILEVGYEGNLGQVVISSTGLSFNVNSVPQFTAAFSQFPTVSQLAAYINSQTGWSADVPSARFNNQAPSQLDQGSYNASSTLPDVQNARIKMDAYEWATAVNGGSLVTWTVLRPGLPEATANFQFLSNGAKGGTSSAAFTAAIDATMKLSTNFIVPLVSQDASKDILAGLTDPSSTYAVDAVNSYLLENVLLMSGLQQKANRIAIGSVQDTFNNCVEEAGTLGSYRFGLAFQPVQCFSYSANSNQLFQPWMSAIVAAGMSAAAGYKGIVKKFANVSGLGTVSGFDSTDPGNRIAALQAGLLFMEKVNTGGIRWNSDQTTYNIDNNFVYNSLQAVYVTDLIALSLIDQYDRQAAGKSVADLTATLALSMLDAQMFNFLRLKWIAKSDDAPKGYKNATADIEGPALIIACEIKVAGLIYFIPITMLASQVTQTATQTAT